jgi:hypothetical protein
METRSADTNDDSKIGEDKNTRPPEKIANAVDKEEGSKIDCMQPLPERKGKKEEKKRKYRKDNLKTDFNSTSSSRPI